MDELKGLSANEAEELFKQYGANEIIEKKQSLVLDFMKRFTGLTAYVIEASMIISAFLKNYVDSIVMFALLILNAVLGFTQEFRATKAIDALKQRLKITAKVLRDGSWQEIPAREIVPNDIIKVSMGDIVPADANIVNGNILVDQSTLTGESIAQERGLDSKIFSGSLVTRGAAICRVTATGGKTYFGKTAELIEKAHPKLIIEDITMSVTKGLLVVDAFFIVAVLAKFIISGTPLKDTLPIILTLLIASIPVALPAMTVLALSLGSLELAKKGVLIRKLDGIENSAMMDVLCLDKTGTITENKIRISDVIVFDTSYLEADVLELALLASDPVTKDPIDSAVIEYSKDKVKNRFRLVKFYPFDPDKKFSAAEVSEGKSSFLVMKGAPQILMPMSPTDNEKISKIVESFAKDGKRSLIISCKRDGQTITIGLLTFFDYPRSDSKDFIGKIKDMGISVKMVTGDNTLIAKSVAESVGIGSNVVSIHDWKDDKKTAAENIDTFAEVVPEDKFNIVGIYQSKNHVVGMTGDGANDAPALKKADLGIAVSNSLEIAKQSAKVILTRSGLSNIVDLINTGRQIYRRIVLWIINKVVKTFQIVFFVSIATLILGKPVITPVEMVLMLFLYDFVTMSIATDNVVASKKPERWNVSKLIKLSLIFGSLKILELFLAMYLAFKYLKLPFSQMQTLMFYLLLVSGLLNILNFREERFFLRSRPSNTILIAIASDIAVATLIVYLGIFVTRIPIIHILIALAYTFVVTLLFTDLLKLFVYKKIRI
ncbi:MAG: plasma-membrane proton-efflux P-type ATPase [Caldisericaceae bacterium]